MRRIQIVDLDGCIADDRWRRKYIMPDVPDLDHIERFGKYHQSSILDFALNLNEITEPHVVVLTGRPLLYHEITLMWLRENAYIEPLYMIMRNNNDHSPSPVLKKRMVHGLLDWNSYGIAREEIVSAIDDRAAIVDMYQRDFGINARVVRIGEEEHVNG